MKVANKPLVINDTDVSDELTSTTLTIERDGKHIILSLFSDYIPDIPGESIILSNTNILKLYRYLNEVLGIEEY